MLRTRIISALIAIPIVIGGVYVGGIWFAVGVALVGLIAGWEFGHIMKAGGYETMPPITMVMIALLIFDGYRPALQLLSLIISVLLLSSLVWQLFRHNKTPTADWALTVAGGLYIGWGLGHLVGLRNLTEGLAWVWVALLATWGADTLAYFVGRAIGKNKLWPRHSPNKTWEGFLGGIGGGMAGAALVAAFSDLSWGSVLVIGAIIPIVTLFGDLSISMMKRDVGVKDTSQLFPGHGGFLDRIDSVLFVSVVVYYYALWIG